MTHHASRTDKRKEKALLPLRAGSINAGRGHDRSWYGNEGPTGPLPTKPLCLRRDTIASGHSIIFRESEVRHKFLTQHRLQRKQRLDAQNIKTNKGIAIKFKG